MRIVDASKKKDGIKAFLDNAKSSLGLFRYFESRSFDVLENHITTLLIFEDNLPVCYGHLDQDSSKVWLGIAVAQDYKGKGYGSIMMNELIQHAKNNDIQAIYLAVDTKNIVAKSLYEKHGFFTIKENDDKVFMKLMIS